MSCDGFPIPIIKSATMAGIADYPGSYSTFLLDGHNNSGFSGGPVVFRSGENKENPLVVLGIISGYRTEVAPVTLAGKPTELASEVNTGIVICPTIKVATDFIDRNPIGPELEFI